jgi:sirohydrochlorin ferrochelatase
MRPGLDVRVSFLDHAGPRPGSVLHAFEALGHRSAVVVPLLLTSAYHGRVDVPAVLAAARADGLRLDVTLTDVLGPVAGCVPPLLLSALRRRLLAVPAYDAVVLAAAGTRDDAARSTVDLVAAELGRSLGLPCRAAFGSGSPVTGAVAVEALRASGAERIAVAAYFLACGRLYDTVTTSARSAGALDPMAEPLGNALDLARLVLERVGTPLAVLRAA